MTIKQLSIKTYFAGHKNLDYYDSMPVWAMAIPVASGTECN